MRNKWQKALILLCVFGKVIDQQGRNFFPSRVAKAGQHVEKPTSDDFPGKKSRRGQIQIQKNDMYYIIYIYIVCTMANPTMDHPNSTGNEWDFNHPQVEVHQLWFSFDAASRMNISPWHAENVAVSSVSSQFWPSECSE